MMRQSIVATLLSLTLLCGSVNTFALEAPKKETIAPTAQSYVLMEATSKKVLLESSKDVQLPPASITKIMTLLLIHEAIEEGRLKWDDIVTVSEHAAHMGGSQIFMEPGEEQPVRDLVKSIGIASANDAAVAMAEHIGGSEQQFVDMMNERAKELGMTHTVFKNACGLHVDGHLSTAYDIALMSSELMSKYPDISKTLTTWMDTITHKTRKGESTFGLTNTNKMIKWYQGITGMKTGYTPQAKFCVSSTAKRDNLSLIAVIMGAEDGKVRFREAASLLDYGFANYTMQSGPQIGEVLGQTKVKKGEMEVVDLTIEESLNFVVPKGNQTELTYEITCEEEVKAPVYKDQKLGKITYSMAGEKVGEADLVAKEDVDKASLRKMIPYMAKRFFKTDQKKVEDETEDKAEDKLEGKVEENAK